MVQIALSVMENVYILLSAISAFVLFGVIAPLHKRKKLQLTLSTLSLIMVVIGASYVFTASPFVSTVSLFAIYPFSMFFVILFSIALILINILSYRNAKDYIQFSTMLSFIGLGLFAVSMANSLITILLGIELVTIPTAFAILLNGKNYVEAAVKLFIMAAIGVSMIAFAIVLLFPLDPQLSLSMTISNSSSTATYLSLLSLLLFIAGLSFDASLFPFNLWVPDVYAGAPGYITALLAGVNKKIAFVALFEILFIVMAPFSSTFALLFQGLAIATMFFGNIAAMIQDNVKRLFAYSSISQAGYIAIGLATATAYGISASIFQIAAHMFMIIGTFAIVMWLEQKNVKTLNDYNGLSARNGFAALSLTVFMLSMIGMPPLMGFVGKFLLFTGAISANLLPLAVLAIINSFISVYYYAKVILAMYSKREREALPADASVNAVVWICLILIVLLGIYPQPLITITSISAASLQLLH